jgi:hypothetical protein
MATATRRVATVSAQSRPRASSNLEVPASRERIVPPRRTARHPQGERAGQRAPGSALVSRHSSQLSRDIVHTSGQGGVRCRWHGSWSPRCGSKGAPRARSLATTGCRAGGWTSSSSRGVQELDQAAPPEWSVVEHRPACQYRRHACFTPLYGASSAPHPCRAETSLRRCRTD